MRLKKQLFMKYVYGQDISMNKSPNSIIFLLKTAAHCWEADGNGAKLRPPNWDLKLVIKMSHRAGAST